MNTPATAQSFKIVSADFSIQHGDFDVAIESDLTPEKIHDLMRRQNAPITSALVEIAPGGFVLHFPKDSIHLAGVCFANLMAGQFTGKPDPRQSALAALARDNIPERIEADMQSFREQQICEYYRRIDAGDVEWVIALFAPDARYLRADEIYDGRDSIAHFYRDGRKIRGSHTLENVVVHGITVFVRGVFDGVGAMQQPKQVSFCDVWQFNRTEQVALRQTYLAIGASYVRE